MPNTASPTRINRLKVIFILALLLGLANLKKNYNIIISFDSLPRGDDNIANTDHEFINVAKGKFATQSSVLESHGANLAVDGDIRTYSHTKYGSAWIQIDLQKSYHVHSINVLNRWCKDRTDGPGCLCRLSYAKLSLLDRDGIIVETREFENTCGVDTIVEEFHYGCLFEIAPSNFSACLPTAQKVKIESTTEKPIQLFEVQVMSPVINYNILPPDPATDGKMTDTSLKSDNDTATINATKHESQSNEKKNPKSLKSDDHAVQINATKAHNKGNDTSVSLNRSIESLVLPNVLIIGAQKAGTTAIGALLHSNGVCPAQTFPGEPGYFAKEVHFFNDKERYREGIEFYTKRFEKCRREDKQFIMDATPNYLNQAQRVYETYTDKKAQNSAIKNLKLICIVREPISRELSLYNHMVGKYLHNPSTKVGWHMSVVHKNSTIKTFDEYSDEIADGIRSNPHGAFGLYVDHLKEWVKLFGRGNLLILSYDELKQEPSMVTQRLEHFLGINLAGNFSHANTHDSQSKVKEVFPHAKEVLGPLFKDKNEELYEFIRDHPGPSMEQIPFPRFKDF